jgi:hypothetical protein
MGFRAQTQVCYSPGSSAPMSEYDVFLSYSGDDLSTVARLDSALVDLGLRVWFAPKVLTPGEPWQRDLLQGVEKSSSTVICIGPSGFGKWQKFELEAAIHKQVEGEHRVIPVILPGVSDANMQLPSVLKRNTWVLLSEHLEDRATLERLYWGITGKKLVATARPVTQPRPLQNEAIEEAVGSLAETLSTENVTYFVGAGAYSGAVTLPPSSSEITREMLRDLQLIDDFYKFLVPPVDVVGSYYAANSSTGKLENKVVDMIHNRSSVVPKLCQQLADLLSLLAHRPTPRIRARVQQLIVTTNLDVMIERALLQKGISFTRLVQHTSSAKIEVNRYRNVVRVSDSKIQISSPEGAQTIALDRWDDLDTVIANNERTVVGDASLGGGRSTALNSLPVKELCGDDPILYKFRGSTDVRGSCALSVEQYLNYTRSLLQHGFVPAQLSEILSNSPVLLFGYGYFDPDFRLVFHGLLHTAVELRRDTVYSVQLPPDQEPEDSLRKMEVRLWDKVKQVALRDLKIHTLESSCEEFLQLLISSVGRALRVA